MISAICVNGGMNRESIVKTAVGIMMTTLRKKVTRMANWIDYGNDKVGHSLKCSACGEDYGDNLWLADYWYCPNCGSKMEVPDD